MKPKLTPWSRFRLWKCINCGLCCKVYTIPLKIGEALNLVKKYGNVVYSAGGKFYLKKLENKQCIFLSYDKTGKSMCTIYNDRPQACIMYPFYIYREPKSNSSDEAAEFKSDKLRFYVYIDTLCLGLNHMEGLPVNKVIGEIIKTWYLTEETCIPAI